MHSVNSNESMDLVLFIEVLLFFRGLTIIKGAHV